MNLRKITSLTMFISFILCILTSVILYITPHGRVAFWSEWRLWGLSKTQWSDLHLNLGVLFLLAGLLHVYYNWKPITAYLRDRTRTLRVFTVNFNIALILAIAFGLGTYFHVPPMSTILDISESIKDAAAARYGEPPYGHAELSSLKMFARRVGLDLDRSLELLRQAGIRYENRDQSIVDIARANNLTPKQVYDIIRSAEKKSDVGARPVSPGSPPPGFGRKKLSRVCADFGLQVPDVLRVLSARGITVDDAAHSIREIAASNHVKPTAIFEIINEERFRPGGSEKGNR